MGPPLSPTLLDAASRRNRRKAKELEFGLTDGASLAHNPIMRGNPMKARSRSWLALPFAAAVLGFGGAGPAQAQGAPLINVMLVNVSVLNNIANNLQIRVSQIPISVLAPISVAANVCGIQAAVLSTVVPGSRATCTARATGRAPNAIVLRSITG